MQLKILSGGAAHGLVDALSSEFKGETGADIDGTFGAVGAIRDKLLKGEPADLLILTSALIGELAREGHVLDGSARALGVVPTAIAVRSGQPLPPIGDAAALRTALGAADGIYCPDPKLATAGIHFMKVLDALGLRSELEARLRTFPNGATAMREMAESVGRAIGCTQATEILGTPGVTLAGPLPKEFELATVYTCGICTRAGQPALARRFAALLTSEATREIRKRLGFGSAS